MRAAQDRNALPWMLGASVLFVAVLYSQSMTAPKVPKELQAPDGQNVIASFIGRGHQIYVCQNTGAAYTWKLKAPDAQLLDGKGSAVGRHYAGPTWESSDGSRVTGKLLASVPSPSAQAIPWLLLAAAGHQGDGIMSKVETVQRVETQGGIPPSIACEASNKDENVLVPYQARYYFYGTP